MVSLVGDGHLPGTVNEIGTEVGRLHEGVYLLLGVVPLLAYVHQRDAVVTGRLHVDIGDAIVDNALEAVDRGAHRNPYPDHGLAFVFNFLEFERGSGDECGGITRHVHNVTLDVDWARQLLATWPAGEETTPPGWLDAELIDRFRPELALAAGAERWGTLVESMTIDWEQLPRGWVATGENNARWVLDLDVEGKVHCAVAVDGPQEVRWFGGVPWGRQPGEGDRLGFDLFSGSVAEPVLSGELGYDSRARGWVGSVTGTAEQTARLRQGRENIYYVVEFV